MIHSPAVPNRIFRRFVDDMRQSKQFSPRGFTLIEMLVALAATLLMMGATVTLFGVIVDSVSGSRSLLEISDKLRATRNRIQADLQGATATMRPPLRPENDEGYLEIIEGPNFDGAPNYVPPPPGQPPLNTLFGDTDDALLLTVRSRGEPFVGKFRATAGPPPVDSTIDSQVAEIAYFVKQDGPVIDATSPVLRLCTLYRRMTVVVPGQQGTLTNGNTPLGPPVTPAFYDMFDVSARVEGGVRVANSLGDLTKPENRTGHNTLFPTRFATSLDPALPPLPFSAASGRLGDDILMTNVLSFDVQVYDPGAPVFVFSGTAVEPRDQGFVDRVNASGATPPVAVGAYADLGYLRGPLSPYPAIGPPYSPPGGFPAPQFGGLPDPQSTLGAIARPFVYDTWSLHYENDGLDRNNNPAPPAPGDLATNGLDDNANGIVDDILERDTMPPYPAPLRGVRITIRVYEPSSLQVRQVTIVQDFLPE